MEVILKEDIKNLGVIGDIVSVKPGYGRNFLVPQGKAVFVTADNLKQLELQKEELRKKQDDELAALREKAQTFEGLKLTIEANVTDEGTLYGSIGTIDIANAAIEKGIELEKSFINMPDGPIKIIGSHEVELLLHPEIQVMITVEVIGGEVAIKNTLDSEEEEDNINEENIDTENTEESE
jgi:large subunit ribosomal protein L9